MANPGTDKGPLTELSNGNFANRVIVTDTTGNNVTVTRAIDEDVQHEEDATYDYYAFAPSGTTLATAGWKAFRVPKIQTGTTPIKQYAGGALYNQVATALAGLTYAY